MLEELCKIVTVTGVSVGGTINKQHIDVTVECELGSTYGSHPLNEPVPNKDFLELHEIKTEPRYFEDTLRVLQKEAGFRAQRVMVTIDSEAGEIFVFAKLASDGVIAGIGGGHACVDDSVEGEDCPPFRRKLGAELNKLGKAVYKALLLIESKAFADLVANMRSTGGLVIQE